MEDDYRKAGRIAWQCLENGARLIKPGASLLGVAEAIEKDILSKADGLAFPVNMSLNNQAAHYTPGIEDSAVFGNEVVKLDVGAHVKGCIGDTAITIDLSGEHGKLVEASEKALDEAIAMIKPGVNSREIGAVIEATINKAGFRPIANLSGHVMEPYQLHTGLGIPNVAATAGFPLEEGMVIAIEPFASAGRGHVAEDRRVEIFSVNSDEQTRNPDGRKIVAYANKLYKNFPFAERWLTPACHGLSLKIALREIVSKEIFQPYPILIDSGLVSQAEKTIIVTADGCEVTTR